MLFTDAPFQPGEYLEYANGLLGGTQEEGKEFLFLDVIPPVNGQRAGTFRYDPAATPSTDPKIAMRVRLLRVVRNVSGVNLAPGRLVVLGRDSSINGLTAVTHAIGSSRISGYARMGRLSTRGSVYCRPLDEFLPAAGVPNNALCYVVMKGPAKVYMPLAQTTADIAAGDLLCAATAGLSAATGGISGGGRLDRLDPTATTYPAGFAAGIIGAALEAMSSQATTGNVQILVDIGGHV